jgi:glycosyltransferase involved in cell wall biosynthesis
MDLKRRLKILFVPQWYPGRDSASQVCGTFCREHARAAALCDDVAVLVLTSRLQRWPTLQWEKVDDHGLPTFYATYGRSPIPKTTRFLLGYLLRRAFLRVVDEWGFPDVIHTQDIQAYHVIKAMRRFGIPFVISQHWSGFLERLIDPSSLRKYRWAFDHAVRVLPTNKFTQKDYDQYGLRPRMTWLPNVLDTEVFTPSRVLAKEPWLLHASGLSREKRVPDIIQAFAQLSGESPSAVLHLVGDGPDRGRIETLARRRLPPDTYHFHGYLSKPQLAELMRRSRGFVLASDAETFGCVLMEAMACGCPVVTTRVGGIPAVVRQGDGLFAEVGNIEQIADGMRRLLNNDHGLDVERISGETRERFSRIAIGRILHEEHSRAAENKVLCGGTVAAMSEPIADEVR